jgi:hypothetical protein
LANVGEHCARQPFDLSANDDRSLTASAHLALDTQGHFRSLKPSAFHRSLRPSEKLRHSGWMARKGVTAVTVDAEVLVYG